jgi:DNA-binding PadR family transcriptional regulator
MANDSIGEFEQLVLLAVLRLGQSAYGVPIAEELARHTSRPILRPSVYVALRRLGAKGLIRSRLGEPEPRRGGRARRYFELEPAGLELLRESRRTLMSLWDGVAPLDEAP